MKYRVIAIDFGIHCTGIAAIEIEDGNDAVHVVALQCNAVNTPIGEMCMRHIDPFITGNDKCIVVYENNYHYRNWDVLRKQKAVRQIYKTRGVPIRALQPSQKAFMGRVAKGNRKVNAVRVVTEVLNNLEDKQWLVVFKNLERNHDVADAMLMALYVKEHMSRFIK